MNILSLIGRDKELFKDDLFDNGPEINNLISNSKFLVIGGAGSIGQAVTKEIFIRNPKTLHVLDISENNLVELVRDLRSSEGYITGDFKTFAIDNGSKEFESLYENEGPYDYVLNLSALKHVRSEKDQYTLMRMIEVNILNTIKTLKLIKKSNIKKYFCVSTDKAANPVNMMGASKRIMEMFLMQESHAQEISMSRFANVAFSDGSLLHGFQQRFIKKQPFSAPNDVMRYFLTPKESGLLCLFSTLIGKNNEIFFPKLNKDLDLLTFSEIALRFLKINGFEGVECENEEEARKNINILIKEKKWPCFFFQSDTTGEKDEEEFYTQDENIDFNRFKSIGVINNQLDFEVQKLEYFLDEISRLSRNGYWEKKDLLELFSKILPAFNHEEKNKYLDDKM